MDENLIKVIAAKIRQGEVDRRKMVTFHAEVLLNADKLTHVNPEDFCLKVGMTESVGREFRKMMNVAEMLKEQGYCIEKR